MGLDSFPRPPTHRSAMAAKSSRQYASRDRDESYSPPRTPPSQRNKRKMAQPGLGVRAAYPETFLDDITPIEYARASESGDEPDPHDLALSPKHMTRTSVVDNMLLSLDQFGSGSPLFSDSRFFDGPADSDPYTGITQYSGRHRGRVRGHTFSSSISSGMERYSEEASDYPTIPRSRGHRSNSSSTFQGPQRRYDSSRTQTASGPGTRGKSYAPSTTGESPQTRRGHSQGQGGKDSVSSLDHNPNFIGNAPNYVERRSASLDYGSRPAFLSDPVTEAGLFADDIEAAPTPTVPAGPRRDMSTSLNDFSGLHANFPPPRTPALSRRNSTRSSKSTATRKGRSDTLGTSAIKGREDSIPPLPTTYMDLSAPGPTVSYHKPAPLPSAEPTPVKEKPGFFRRVFGSSKSSESPQPMSPLESSRDSKHSLRSSPAANNQVHQEAVVAKKASFFRRRKKSIVDNVPPPLNLVHANLRMMDQVQAEPSPVSSLRKVMNPYLADEIPSPYYGPAEFPDGPLDHSRIETDEPEVSSSRNQTLRNVARESRTAEGPRNNGVLRTKYSLNLDNPSHDHDDSFMAESSGKEDLNPTAGNLKQRIGRPKTSPVAPAHQAADDDDHHQPFVNSKLSVSTSKGKSPQMPPGSFLNAEDSANSSRGSLLKDGMTEDPRASNSDISQYHTASNTPVTETPIIATEHSSSAAQSGSADVPIEAEDDTPSSADRDQARQLFDSQEEVLGTEPAAAWLGNPDRAMVRKAYMQLFDWSNMDILAAFRSLCTKMVLKGETQQVDRVLDALSARWCECNPNHGFKAVDVVHTICYSLLLLNTDLHLADIEQKMTRNQFVRNTLPTIYRVASDAAPDGFETIRPPAKSRGHASILVKSPILPPGDFKLGPAEADAKPVNRTDTLNTDNPTDSGLTSNCGPLVKTPFNGTIKAWEAQVETVLKDFYSSIQKQRLPLHNSQPEVESLAPPSTTHLGGGLRRSPSVLSKTGSDILPRGRSADSRMTTGRWSSKPRSRARLYPASHIGSSRTSLDDQSSVWSPSGSSTWSKYSLGKTLTSMSVDSFGSEYPRGDYQQSIGFANALSHAIIREDSAQSIASFEESTAGPPLLEDETLELAGAPWAKEGSLKHKQHLDSVDKRAKDRNWNECFAVIQRGWLRLFSFNANSKSMRLKAKQRQNGGAVVGGGNWMENAEEVWKFLLRQTIASALPPPGYSKSRPHVWALSLPTGAVHLFQVGTSEIVKEFVTTANYWSARLSKEPLIGGISNMEYGWSDAIVNSALVNSALVNIDKQRSPPNSSGAPRPSFQSSIRSSLDQQGGVRAKLPADRVHLSDWTPPQQSMVASQFNEADQLKALQNYVKNVEEDLQKHNELRPAMMLAFSPRHPNANKAMTNWERKSSYLLREIVKFRTYIDCLHAADVQKEKIYSSRNDNEESHGISGQALPADPSPANLAV